MNYKFFFLLCLSSVSHLAYGATCEYEWDVSAKGIHLGVSKDKVTQNNDEVVINSDFKPSKLARAFGLKNVQRNVFFSKGELVKRQEFQNSQEQTLIEWSKVDNNKWMRTSKSDGQRVESVENTIMIDSTSFLYLYTNKLIELTNKIKNVTVLSKNKLYPANVSLNLSQNESLTFKSEKNYGEVKFKDYQPYSFKLDDDRGTVVGQIKSMRCD